MAKQGINTEHGHLYSSASLTIDIVSQSVAVAIGHASDVETGAYRHALLTPTTGKIKVGPGRAKVSYKARTSTAAKAPKTVVLKDGVAQAQGADIAPAGAALLCGEAIFDITAPTEFQIGLSNETDTADLTVTAFDFTVEMLESREPRQPRV